MIIFKIELKWKKKTFATRVLFKKLSKMEMVNFNYLTFDCSNRAGDEQENSSSSPNNSGVSLYGIRKFLTSSIYEL